MGPDERVVVSLPNVEKILEIGYKFDGSELAHRYCHCVNVGLRRRQVGVVVEPLPTVIDAFDPDAIDTRALEHQVGARSMTIEQRHFFPTTRLDVGSSSPR